MEPPCLPAWLAALTARISIFGEQSRFQAVPTPRPRLDERGVGPASMAAATVVPVSPPMTPRSESATQSTNAIRSNESHAPVRFAYTDGRFGRSAADPTTTASRRRNPVIQQLPVV